MRNLRTPLIGLRSVFGGRQWNGLPRLTVTTAMAITWAGNVATITAPVWGVTPDAVTYTATVDGAPVTITGMTFPAVAGVSDRSLVVTAVATKAGYANGSAAAAYVLAASIWDVVGQALQILINAMPIVTAPTAVGGVNQITVTG